MRDAPIFNSNVAKLKRGLKLFFTNAFGMFFFAQYSFQYSNGHLNMENTSYAITSMTLVNMYARPGNWSVCFGRFFNASDVIYYLDHLFASKFVGATVNGVKIEFFFYFAASDSFCNVMNSTSDIHAQSVLVHVKCKINGQTFVFVQLLSSFVDGFFSFLFIRIEMWKNKFWIIWENVFCADVRHIKMTLLCQM